MLHQWLKDNARFAQSLGYGSGIDSDLYGELEELHRIWFTIKELEKKKSGLADKAKQDAVASFHMRSTGIMKKLQDRFQSWLNAHKLPGWWDRARADLRQNYINYTNQRQKNPRSMNQSTFDIDQYFLPDQLTDILARRYAEEEFRRLDPDEVEQMVVRNNMYYNAFEFLKVTGQMEDGIHNDAEAFEHVKTSGLLPRYTEYLMKKHDFVEELDPTVTYGKKWYDAMPQEFLEQLAKADDLGPLAFSKYSSRWPTYNSTTKNVEHSLQRLSNVNVQDVDAVMTAITLALNTAHNSGMMGEHMGLSEPQLRNLSNLDMSKEHEKVNRYMSWVRDNCRFAQ